MNKHREEAKERYSKDFTQEELEDIVSKYEEKVKQKTQLVFELIKMNSNSNDSGIEVGDGCVWCDALQNMISTLLRMLKTAEGSTGVTESFARKIVANIQSIFIEVPFEPLEIKLHKKESE